MFSLFGFGGDNLPSPVESALWADSVEEHRVPAVSAQHQRRCCKFHVYGTAPASSRLRSPKFRYSHDITSFALSFGQYNCRHYTNLEILSRAKLRGSAHYTTPFSILVKEGHTVFPALFARERVQFRWAAFSRQQVRERHWSLCMPAPDEHT